MSFLFLNKKIRRYCNHVIKNKASFRDTMSSFDIRGMFGLGGVAKGTKAPVPVRSPYHLFLRMLIFCIAVFNSLPIAR